MLASSAKLLCPLLKSAELLPVDAGLAAAQSVYKVT